MTVTEIEDFQNECVKETEDHLYRTIIGNRKEVNKGCSIKNKSPVWAFSIPFCNIACSDGAIWYYCTLCNCVEPSTTRETTTGW